MKIALAQINTTVGALHDNAEKIVAFSQKAREAGAALVVFPELTLTGYPPLDLLDMSHFVDAQLEVLEETAAKIAGISAVVGAATRAPTADGKGLYNSAVVIRDGKVAALHHKRLLPTYDVFDESRYFRPGAAFEIEKLADTAAGVSVCEDVWNDKDFLSKHRYVDDPVQKLAEQGARLLVNISGSPLHLGKRGERIKMLENIARKHKLWVAYTNLVGGNDTLIFDGHSLLVGPDGGVRAMAPGFEETLLLADLDEKSKAIVVPPLPEPEEAYHALVLGIRDYVRKCGFSKALVGLSGGVDSALTCALAADALGPENVRGVTMPSPYSSKGSVADSKALAKNLGVHIDEVPIGPPYEAFRAQLKAVLPARGPEELTVVEENIQARCRGIMLMALSNETGALVLSTGNKSEMAVGYSTLYGDMCGGLAVIGDLPKLLVYELAKWINRNEERIPWNTIEKPPSAELRPNQTDQDTLPPYEVLDPILEAYVEDNKSIAEIAELGFDPELVRQVVRMIDRNEYKRRQAAPILRVTHRAFGPGRQIPIAQRYVQK